MEKWETSLTRNHFEVQNDDFAETRNQFMAIMLKELSSLKNCEISFQRNNHLETRFLDEPYLRSLGNMINSLAPGKCGSNFESFISEHMLWIKFMSMRFFVQLLSGEWSQTLWW